MRNFLLSLLVPLGIIFPGKIYGVDFYVIGSDVNGESWALASPDALMTDNGNGIYEWKGETLGTGFKINDGTWENADIGDGIIPNFGSCGRDIVIGEPYYFEMGGSTSNIVFADATQLINPTVILDMNDLTITVTAEEVINLCQWHLVGTFNDWTVDDSCMMNKIDGDLYQLNNFSISGEGYMKIRYTNWAASYGTESSDTATSITGNSGEIELTKNAAGEGIPYALDGKYTFTWDPASQTLSWINNLNPDYATGSEDAPLSVSDIINRGIPEIAVADCWVKGYIVGCVDGSIMEYDASFEAPFTSPYSLILADSSTERDVAHCIAVQLPRGSIRTSLNLADHPENLGREILLKGSNDKYCLSNGLRSVSYYKWIEDAPVNTDLYSGLVDNANDWTFEEESLPEVITQVWSWESGNDGCLNASANVDGKAYSVGSVYAVSPIIDLMDVTEASVSFDHAAESQTMLRDYCTLLVREARTDKWYSPVIPTWPEAGSWEFVNSGNIDLSDFVGKRIELAFVYASDEVGADTWKIRNVKVINEKGIETTFSPFTPYTPSEPVTPVDPVIYNGLVDNADDWTFEEESLPEVITHVWSWESDNDGCLNASANVDGNAYSVGSVYAVSPIIDLMDVAGASVSFDHAAESQTTLRDYCTLLVREARTDKWYSPVIPKWPEAGSWEFVNSGDIDLSDFVGKRIELAFVYASDEVGADTWKVRNVKVINEKGIETTFSPFTPYTPSEPVTPPDPPTPPTPPTPTPIVIEDEYDGLCENADGWTFENVNIPEEIDNVWAWNNYKNGGYLKASAFADGKAYQANSYAVSPEIDLSKFAEAYISFEHAAKYQTTFRDLCGLRIREAGTATEYDLTIPAWPEAYSWKFVNSGDISLADYIGKKVQIIFAYASSEAGADDWEIKNFKLRKKKSDSSVAMHCETAPEVKTLRGKAVINGLSEGDEITVYNMAGQVITSAKASTEYLEIFVPNEKVIIVRVNDKAVKAIF